MRRLSQNIGTTEQDFIKQNSPEPKTKVFSPMYEPLEVSKCETCGKTTAESKELIEFGKNDILDKD